jgi:hypothetical protein
MSICKVLYFFFRIAELHPSLAEAANHIAAAVHEEAATGNATSQASSSGYSYSLDALSDEEEMDSSQVRGRPRKFLFEFCFQIIHGHYFLPVLLRSMNVVITVDISLRHCVLWYVFIVVTEVKKY